LKTYRGSRGIAPLILNFVTKWKCIVSLTIQQLYTRDRNPASLHGKLVDPPTGLDAFGEEKGKE
jgi:hypothetical protein